MCYVLREPHGLGLSGEWKPCNFNQILLSESSVVMLNAIWYKF